MSVEAIKAKIECDNCGSQFEVRLDPARNLPSGWSIFDFAEDAVRGGYVVGKSIFDGSCSVQNDQMLCITCTRAADNQKEPGA
jgi:hypothetical protein